MTNILNNPPIDNVPRAWTCDAHVDLMERLGRLAALMEQGEKNHASIHNDLTRLAARLESKVEELFAANGKRQIDIAVLKTKAALWGAIAAVIVSPFAVGVAMVIFERFLKPR